MEIGISELQKNISLFRSIKEPLRIIDKKSREILAVVLPRRQREGHIVESLGGIFRGYRPDREYKDTDAMIAEAYEAEMREKYGS